MHLYRDTALTHWVAYTNRNLQNSTQLQNVLLFRIQPGKIVSSAAPSLRKTANTCFNWMGARSVSASERAHFRELVLLCPANALRVPVVRKLTLVADSLLCKKSDPACNETHAQRRKE